MKQLVIRTFIVTIMFTLSGLSIANNNPAVLNIEGDLSIMVLGSGGPVATAAGRASAGYMIFTDGNPSPRIIMDVGGYFSTDCTKRYQHRRSRYVFIDAFACRSHR